MLYDLYHFRCTITDQISLTQGIKTGVYTIIPVYNGHRVCLLPRHAARLATGLALARGKDWSMPAASTLPHADDRDKKGSEWSPEMAVSSIISPEHGPATMASALKQALSICNLDTSRTRLLLQIRKSEHQPVEPILFVEKWHARPADHDIYSNGVHVDLAHHSVQRSKPGAKSMEWLETRRSLYADKGKALDLILIDRSKASRKDPDNIRLMEGCGTNFLLLRPINNQKGGTYELLTAPLGEDVLEGIAQRIALQSISEDINSKGRVFVNITFQTPTLKDLRNNVGDQQAKEGVECFVCSASRAVIPVVSIGDVKIGDGKPGPFFRNFFQTAFRDCLERELASYDTLA